MADGALYSPVTGMEYVGVISRADKYLRSGILPEEDETP